MSVENIKMPDPKQLPYLLNLLDDESEDIRKEIVRQLASFGPELKNELLKLPPAMLLPRENALEKILLAQERETLLKSWPHWQEALSDLERLESALSILARFQCGLKFHYQQQDLSLLLDGLAAEYLAYAKTNDPLELAKFLFEVKGFTGSPNDFYNPQNSNLLYVIHAKKGLPISLSCLYMLVGARAGFVIDGYNFPGHFMGKVNFNGKSFLVDGFNGGKVLDEEAVVQLSDGAVNLEERRVSPTRAVDIVRRVLNNLINAYQTGGESEHQQLMIDLYRTIQPE